MFFQNPSLNMLYNYTKDRLWDQICDIVSYQKKLKWNGKILKDDEYHIVVKCQIRCTEMLHVN